MILQKSKMLSQVSFVLELQYYIRATLQVYHGREVLKKNNIICHLEQSDHVVMLVFIKLGFVPFDQLRSRSPPSELKMARHKSTAVEHIIQSASRQKTLL